MALQIIPSVALAFLEIFAICRLGFRLDWMVTPTSFSYSIGVNTSPSMVYDDHGLYEPICRRWHLETLNSICQRACSPGAQLIYTSLEEISFFLSGYWAAQLCIICEFDKYAIQKIHCHVKVVDIDQEKEWTKD